MTEGDQQHVDKMLRALAQIDPWLARIDPKAAGAEPQPGSSLAGDDKHTAPYHLSHAVWSSLSHAVDHLHCRRTLLNDAQMVHMFAPYTVARAAIENASAAVWMLAPSTRNERIARRLQVAADDFRMGGRVAALTGAQQRRTPADRLDDLRAIAGARSIDQRDALARLNYEEIVLAGGRTAGLGEIMPVLCWRACSGIAHGDLWATRTMTTMVDLGPVGPGVGRFQINANLEMLWLVTATAVVICRTGFNVYDQRSTASDCGTTST